MKADRQATEARRFKDPDSYVCKDGREVLYRKDWDERRFELLQRSRGQCEYWYGAGTDDPHRCSRDAQDPDHIKPRGNHGIDRDDRMTNLQALCRMHHDQKHAKRGTRFSEAWYR